MKEHHYQCYGGRQLIDSNRNKPRRNMSSFTPPLHSLTISFKHGQQSYVIQDCYYPFDTTKKIKPQLSGLIKSKLDLNERTPITHLRIDEYRRFPIPKMPVKTEVPENRQWWQCLIDGKYTVMAYRNAYDWYTDETCTQLALGEDENEIIHLQRLYLEPEVSDLLSKPAIETESASKLRAQLKEARKKALELKDNVLPVITMTTEKFQTEPLPDALEALEPSKTTLRQKLTGWFK